VNMTEKMDLEGQVHTGTGAQNMERANGLRPLRAMMVLFSLWLGFGVLVPVQATANELTSIGFSSLPGNRVEISMNLSGPAAEPLSFSTENPARIALDFVGVKNGLAKKSQSIGVGVASSVNTAEANGRTRVVVNMSQAVGYDTRIEGNTVYLTLESVGSHEAAKIQAKTTVGKERKVTGIDFRRGEKGEGRIFITLADPAMPVDLHQESDKIVVEIPRAAIDPALLRKMDVVDFATPVTVINTMQKGGNVTLSIGTSGVVDHLAYQTGDQYTVEIKKISAAKQEEMRKDKFGYSGERLSLNFQDIEVRAVLQLLADFTGLNIVASDTVQGNLTLRLKNVPWDQALDLILKTKGLTMRQAGNVIRIAPTEEVAAREKLDFESQKQVEELAPVRTEFFHLNFASAEDMLKLFVKGEGAENSLLTERGSAVMDKRTNTIMIKDTDQKIEEVRRLLMQLDIPVRQVLIEARLAIVSTDFNKELGARFGVTGVHDRANGTGIITTTGNAEGNSGVVDDAVTNLMAGPTPYPVGLPALADRFNVSLPASPNAGSIGMAILGSTWLVDLELSALQSEGRGKILGNPRLLTADKKEAFIEQGVEIPYLEASSSGAATVSFRKAVLGLTVTPQITPDDQVILDLNITSDSVGELFGIAGSEVPSINTREMTTQVLVSNGETVVLGGVYEQVTSDTVDKVPFFGDLPGVGILFRKNVSEDNKEEMLIFVTPKIVKDGLSR